MMVVSIATQTGFIAGRPQMLFSGRYAEPGGVIDYDVALDGQRFLMIKEADEQALPRIHLVLNWAEELKRREGSEGP